MPASYAIDPEQKLVLSRIWGTPTEEEILDHGCRLRADPCFRPDFRQLLDMSELKQIQISHEKVRQAARDQFFSPGVRRALVAQSDAVFGMARMYAIASEGEGQTIEVFRDCSEAKVWLGVKEDAPEPI
jgi:hypothetical protein